MVLGDVLDNVMFNKVVFKLGWLEIGVLVFLVLVIVLIVCLFFYEFFQILLGLMMLILFIGDFILVEKFVYGIKDLIYQKILIEIGYLKCGDIVVFKYLEDFKLDYIKCVVGLLGDKIIYDLVVKEVMIQSGCSFGQVCENVLLVIYFNVELSDFVQIFVCCNGGEVISGFFEVLLNEIKENGICLIECKEMLGDVIYCILMVLIVQDQLGMYY